MQNNKGKLFISGLSLLVSGLCVGWMVGLSVSPILQTVLTSVLVVVTAVVSLLAGVSATSPKGTDPPTPPAEAKSPLAIEVNPAPVMLLLVGIALGASFGLFARTNLLLGPNGNWLSGRTGLTSQQIYSRAFSNVYPDPQPAEKKDAGGADKKDGGTKVTGSGAPGLNSLTVNIDEDVCIQLKRVPEADLASKVILLTNDEKIKIFINQNKGKPEVIHSFVEEILCPPKPGQ